MDKDVLLRSKPSQEVNPQGDTSENISSVSDSLAKSSPRQNADDGSIFCTRCNERNIELMPDHLCTQCQRLITGRLKAARTEVQGRIHMINLLEPLDEAERRAVYADLTPMEYVWIMECGMFFAEELAKFESDQTRDELLAGAKIAALESAQ